MTVKKKQSEVFVVMPFSESPNRNAVQLTAFFVNHIKHPIEKARLNSRYKVRRSDDTLNITEQIIKDIFYADIVICDLSGIRSNPNVMYELGLRFALTNKPVILIREKHPDNQPIFDVGGFYAHPYDPLNYAEVTDHILEKLRKFETREERYHSPVLAILKQDIPLLQKISSHRATRFLEAMSASVMQVRTLFGGDVAMFLRSKKLKINPNTADDVLEVIQKRRTAMNKLDWTEFQWSFGTQPALDHYIANRYLTDLVDDDLEALFSAFIVAFHSHFVSTTYYHGSWAARSIWEFLGESRILIDATHVVRAVLAADDDVARTKAGAALKDILAKSHLLNSPTTASDTV
jgi:hypothetical protein